MKSYFVYGAITFVAGGLKVYSLQPAATKIVVILVALPLLWGWAMLKVAQRADEKRERF